MRMLTLEEMTLVGGGCHPNNGWGNGDQNAPGNSLTHNHAENNITPGATGPGGVHAQPLPGPDGCGASGLG